MKVNPYLSFNGNCVEAVALYEKAFNVKAVIEQEENLISHAEFEIGDYQLMLFDSPEPVKIGDNIMITIRFDKNEIELAKFAFETLAQSGEIIMPLEETSWSKCFGLLVDKFGINWNMCQS